jgi:L-malate glycosyltransferase
LELIDIGVNRSSMEGLSNAIMEYMASGVPCIVSNAGGNPELIENGVNGYTFELDNTSELANHIINLLDNKELQ